MTSITKHSTAYKKDNEHDSEASFREFIVWESSELLMMSPQLEIWEIQLKKGKPYSAITLREKQQGKIP